jgi:GTPase KRas protein
MIESPRVTRYFKVALVGDSGVGKSAMTSRFIYNKFYQDYTCTIEDFYKTRINIEDDIYDLDIVDTAGMDEFRAVRDTSIRGRDGFLMVYDVHSYESFLKIDSLLQVILQSRPPCLKQKIPLVFVGNKSDLESKVP